MPNYLLIKFIKKTGSTACFFLFFLSSAKAEFTDQVWQFSSEMQKAYQLVLNLQSDKANELLNKIADPSQQLHKIYVLSLSETVDVLISEDQKKFDLLEAHFRKRLQVVENLPEGPEKLFLQAELNLQRGFNLLNLDQSVSAVFAIRKAYNLTQDCLKDYPNFIPIKKTSGVIQVMIGAVPDKYQWFMSLLGMQGSVVTGQRQLQDLRNSNSSLSLEATLLYFTIKGLINQQFSEASKGLLGCLKEQPENRLVLFLAINMVAKDSQSETALELISKLDHQGQGLQMDYVEYLRAEALLNKGEYSSAIVAYQKFIKGYRSPSFKKDANYKIGICNWLMNDEAEAKLYFERAKVTGRAQADPDRYAAAQLEEKRLPNQKLLKLRFSTDGGFFQEAQAVLQTLQFAELKTVKDQTEYFYRKGRLAQKLDDFEMAKVNYHKAIQLAKENPWYFAPNAALQLGYIYRDQKNYVMAKKYFELALTYKKHEYKSSIDSKSRSALDQLKFVKI